MSLDKEKITLEQAELELSVARNNLADRPHSRAYTEKLNACIETVHEIKNKALIQEDDFMNPDINK